MWKCSVAEILYEAGANCRGLNENGSPSLIIFNNKFQVAGGLQSLPLLEENRL